MGEKMAQHHPTAISSETYPELIRELGTHAQQVIREDARLIAAETLENIRGYAGKLVQSVIWSGLLVAGFIPLVAALVVGLGRLLDERYALSSAIVGVVITGVSVFLLRRSLRGLRKFDFDWSESRRALAEQADLIKTKVLGDRIGSRE